MTTPEFKCLFCGTTDITKFRELGDNEDRNTQKRKRCKTHYNCSQREFEAYIKTGLTKAQALEKVLNTVHAKQTQWHQNKITKSDGDSSDSEEDSPPEPKKKVTFKLEKKDTSYDVLKAYSKQKVYGVIFLEDKDEVKLNAIISALDRIYDCKFIACIQGWHYFTWSKRDAIFSDKLEQICLVIDMKIVLMSYITLTYENPAK